ncbi:hypothetical protein T05_15483 [Trichinella murrelli]|uniref:Uncharacterized protein n=1 Tax=Trichinella murrelli TaxID=144512 RepID=A0A0V0SPE9_9BILA|nr:hypothetical protein T05_15483 [Trichinella murrelli]
MNGEMRDLIFIRLSSLPCSCRLMKGLCFERIPKWFQKAHNSDLNKHLSITTRLQCASAGD